MLVSCPSFFVVVHFIAYMRLYGHVYVLLFRIPQGSLTAGRGGGVTVTYGPGAALNIDGKPFGLITNSFAQGGEDCYPQDDNDPYFPNTYGGFGGGGGGCGNGGGGGGYGGGNVPIAINNQYGMGGYSKRPDGSEVIGENHGDGFVSFRLEHCGCAGNCSIDYERSVFWCTCPVETTPALDGLDCYIGKFKTFLSNSVTRLNVSFCCASKHI